jgi:hypothetical protein
MTLRTVDVTSVKIEGIQPTYKSFRLSLNDCSRNSNILMKVQRLRKGINHGAYVFRKGCPAPFISRHLPSERRGNTPYKSTRLFLHEEYSDCTHCLCTWTRTTRRHPGLFNIFLRRGSVRGD